MISRHQWNVLQISRVILVCLYFRICTDQRRRRLSIACNRDTDRHRHQREWEIPLAEVHVFAIIPTDIDSQLGVPVPHRFDSSAEVKVDRR